MLANTSYELTTDRPTFFRDFFAYPAKLEGKIYFTLCYKFSIKVNPVVYISKIKVTTLCLYISNIKIKIVLIKINKKGIVLLGVQKKKSKKCLDSII